MKLLRTVFLIDAIITVSFGLYSWLAPKATFGTIIAIPENNEPLTFAILSSLSIMYILVGLVSLIGFGSKPPTSLWIAGLLLLRHGWIGTLNILDIGKEWLIGNPYPDIVIHGMFAVCYITGIILILRSKKQLGA